MSEVTYVQLDTNSRVTGVVQVFVTAGPHVPPEIIEPEAESTSKKTRDVERAHRESARQRRQERIDEMAEARAEVLRSDLAVRPEVVILDPGTDPPIPGMDRLVDGQWVRDPELIE